MRFFIYRNVMPELVDAKHHMYIQNQIQKNAYCIGDKLYYNLNEFDSPAHSLLVTVTEVNEDNIVCKDSTGISYMFDEDMLDCLTNNPIYTVKKIKIKDSFEKDI